MTKETDVIDKELDRMGNDTVAISYEKDANLPDGVENLFERINGFTLDDYRGQTVQYVNPENGFDPDSIEELLSGDDWATVHSDGQAHLESIKKDIINQKRKQRRMRFR